ncbi:hypothetical protein GCM10009634_44450 [Saccharothrix xinjiangensis]
MTTTRHLKINANSPAVTNEPTTATTPTSGYDCEALTTEEHSEMRLADH